jgi:hypothetical protein
MHSHTPPGEPGLRPVCTGRRLARRAKVITAPFWQGRHRRPERWVDPEAGLRTPGRAPEESYRDYMFRKAFRP